jgi:putative membrane protein
MIALLTWHHHGWLLLWPLVPLLWLFGFLVLARFVFWRGRRGPWAPAQAVDPRAILAERYARGEISVEEYRERLSNLEQR